MPIYTITVQVSDTTIAAQRAIAGNKTILYIFRDN